MKRAFLVLAFLLPAVHANADPLYDKCIRQSDGTNSAWAECGGAWVKRADKALNAAWKKIYGVAEGQTKTDLLAEQRLWNSYKEESCKFYANGDWGREGQVLSFPACRAKVIEARTAQLLEYNER